MRIASALGLALRRLRKRPVRSVLLLQGTIWGVAVAIFPSAVIQGTREAALTRGAQLGADRIAVAADPTSATRSGVQRSDLTAVRKALSESRIDVRGIGGVSVAHTVAPSGEAVSGDPVTVLRSTVGAENARGLTLARGRWLEADDGAETCVVEADVADALGGDPLQPGDSLQLPGWEQALTVVGVADQRSSRARRTNDLGFDLDHAMYKNMAQAFLLAMGIPLVRDAWKRSDRCVFVPLGGNSQTAEVDWMFVRVDSSQVSRAADVTRDTFARNDKAVVTLYPLVLPMMLGQDIERFAALNLAMFLACLLMGAVVMMNLGLLSVLTRSREIAIRRSEGATRDDIARQFLGEGLLLSLVGAGLGCLLGIGLAQLRVALEPVTGFTWAFPTREALMACGVAFFVGVLASVLPAIRASRQDPVRGLSGD